MQAYCQRFWKSVAFWEDLPFRDLLGRHVDSSTSSAIMLQCRKAAAYMGTLSSSSYASHTLTYAHIRWRMQTFLYFQGHFVRMKIILFLLIRNSYVSLKGNSVTGLWVSLTVDWDTFTLALWRCHRLMFWGFFTALTKFLSSTAFVFLGRLVRPGLLLSAPAVSLFFRTFQVVVQANNNSFPSFKMACFSPKADFWSSGWFIFSNTNVIFTDKPKAKTKNRHSVLCIG